MPLEVTPVPFVEQQLPYNPKFIRDEVRANGEGSMPGGAASMVSGPGPLAAAASTLIAPTPGGVAGPHNAIPALPDAGYTAPGLRATGLGLDFGGSLSARSSLSDGYGPGGPASYMSSRHAPMHHPPDAFGRAPHLPPPAPASALSGHSWAPSAQGGAFLGPRRASNPALVPSLAESTIAPRGVSHHGGLAIDPRHQHDHLIPEPHGHHHHHRPHHRRTRSHNRTERDDDDWDAKSDASYYARPKPSRARSGSSLSDITNSSATVRQHHQSHTHHHGHTQSARGSPGGGGQHDHSPISPSPLARGLPPHAHCQPVPSPLSPKTHTAARRSRKISDLGADQGVPPPQSSPYKRVTPIAPEQEYSPSGQGLRTLHERSEKGSRRYSASYASDTGHEDRSRRPRSPPHGYASDDEGRYSSRSRDGRRDKSAHRRDDATSRHQSTSRRRPRHVAEAYPDNEYDDDRHHAHYSHSHSRVPPPLPYRAPSPTVPGTLQVPGHHQSHLMPDIGSLSISGEGRRRAHSMQQMQHPGGMVSSPASLAGFGGGGAGPYQTPSVAGMANADAYDDGASIAGSAMTFMDGAVAGRTSHYGLPKYPHQAKPDYRRFMVQRGKADVYLD